MLNRTQRQRSCLGIEAYENLKLGVSGKLNIFILAVKNTPQNHKVWFWHRKVGCERVPIISLRFIINSRQKPIISVWWPGVLYDVVSRYPVDIIYYMGMLCTWAAYMGLMARLDTRNSRSARHRQISSLLNIENTTWHRSHPVFKYS